MRMGLLQHLIDLADSDHGTVRVVPFNSLFRESRDCNFDLLSFASIAFPDHSLSRPVIRDCGVSSRRKMNRSA